jgi:hypothetical protein
MTDALHGDMLPSYRPGESLPRRHAEVSAIVRSKAPFGAAAHAFSAKEIDLQAGTPHHDIARLRDRREGIVVVVQCSKIKQVVVP